MKANELMVGDWVMYNPNVFIEDEYERPQEPYPLQIEDGEDIDLVIEGCYSPIPLTPEILEKNNWHKEVDKLEYMAKYDLNQNGKNCWMVWAINERSLDIQRQSDDMKYNLCVHRVIIPCDYVHQLQHALRLCGINKDIEL